MTIGIAAHAVLQLKSRIILCCDWMVGDDFSSSETTLKLDSEFSRGLVSICSGSMEQVADLKRICRTQIADKILDRVELKQKLHNAAIKFTGMLAKRKLEMTATLLVAGFLKSGPGVFCVGNWGVYERIHPEVGIIGIGATYAEPLLRWRTSNEPLNTFSNFHDVLYRVYEAKRFSETSKDVGRRTTIAVMRPGDSADECFRMTHLTAPWKDFLEDYFQKHGPQRLPEQREYFMDFPGVI